MSFSECIRRRLSEGRAQVRTRFAPRLHPSPFIAKDVCVQRGQPAPCRHRAAEGSPPSTPRDDIHLLRRKSILRKEWDRENVCLSKLAGMPWPCRDRGARVWGESAYFIGGFLVSSRDASHRRIIRGAACRKKKKRGENTDIHAILLSACRSIESDGRRDRSERGFFRSSQNRDATKFANTGK